MPVLRSKKIAAVTTKNYIIWLEWFRDRMWVHVDVFRWTAGTKRNYQEDFKKLAGPLYAVNTSRTKKLEKFILLTDGWEFYGKQDFGDGIAYDVYRRL